MFEFCAKTLEERCGNFYHLESWRQKLLQDHITHIAVMFCNFIIYISKKVNQHFQNGNRLPVKQLFLYSWSQITFWLLFENCLCCLFWPVRSCKAVPYTNIWCTTKGGITHLSGHPAEEKKIIIRKNHIPLPFDSDKLMLSKLFLSPAPARTSLWRLSFDFWSLKEKPSLG